MSRELHGSREIVEHSVSEDFTLFLNHETESYASHWHSELEIAMPLENTYTVIIEGQTYVLNPYDIMIIPSGVSHELIAPPSGRRLFILVRHQILREVKGFDIIYNRFFPCAIFRYAEDSVYHSRMISQLESIIDEYTSRRPLWEAAVHGLLILFFLQGCRIFLTRNEVPAMKSRTRTQRMHTDTFFSVCTYISEHCTDRLSLEDAARIAGFSRSQFIRLFKEYSGTSFYDYLTRQRMIKADLMLSEPDYSITDIAMQCGFGSLSTFNRVFRSYHSCTPMEYRKNIQRKKEQPQRSKDLTPDLRQS